MKAGPNISLVASLVGDPARANMLTALMSGRALTASELAQEAGITAQTASSHLSKLETGGLIARTKQGRHRYFRLADEDIADVLEGLMGLAARAGHMRVRTGPKDPALRKARVCYNHLAGETGVAMLDSLTGRGMITQDGDALTLTDAGRRFMSDFGINVDGLGTRRRPLCRACLDWSSRRSHLAGALGTALLGRIYALKWATREPGTRVVRFSRTGEREFENMFSV